MSDNTADNASLNNSEDIKGVQCGCFYCLRVFSGDVVREFIDNGYTALCPFCSVDAVLPNVTDRRILKRIHDNRFN